MSGSVKLNFLEGGKVRVEDPLHTVHLGVENISVQSETMRCGSHVWAVRQLSAEAVDWVHLICVVVLKDAHNSLNGLGIIILIVLWI